MNSEEKLETKVGQQFNEPRIASLNPKAIIKREWQAITYFHKNYNRHNSSFLSPIKIFWTHFVFGVNVAAQLEHSVDEGGLVLHRGVHERGVAGDLKRGHGSVSHIVKKNS